MYLIQLYRYKKWLFTIIAFFIAAQLYINSKHGVVVSPFFHYGMYSMVIKVNRTYNVFEVRQNGIMLKGEDFTPQEWDKILLPLQYFTAIQTSNKLYKNDIARLFKKIGLSTTEQNFVIHCNYQQFISWYSSYLGGITGTTTASIAVGQRLYIYNGKRLEPTNKVIPLSQLCH